MKSCSMYVNMFYYEQEGKNLRRASRKKWKNPKKDLKSMEGPSPVNGEGNPGRD